MIRSITTAGPASRGAVEDIASDFIVQDQRDNGAEGDDSDDGGC